MTISIKHTPTGYETNIDGERREFETYDDMMNYLNERLDNETDIRRGNN